MTAGIIIDDWKWGIFDSHLTRANYRYKSEPGMTEDTITLKVEFTDLHDLKAIVQSANDEAERKGKP